MQVKSFSPKGLLTYLNLVENRWRTDCAMCQMSDRDKAKAIGIDLTKLKIGKIHYEDKFVLIIDDSAKNGAIVRVMGLLKRHTLAPHRWEIARIEDELRTLGGLMIMKKQIRSFRLEVTMRTNPQHWHMHLRGYL